MFPPPMKRFRVAQPMLFIASLLVLFLAGGCQGRSEKVQSIISHAAINGEWQGTAFVKLDSDTLAMMKSDWFANEDHSVPGFDSPVALASLSKLFTTVLVLDLAESGRLDLDATLAQVRPTFQSPNADSITIRQLLAHRAGLPREYNLNAESSPAILDAEGFAGPWLDTLDLVLETRPGEEERYSNLGYWLLGAVLEEVIGESIKDVLTSRLSQKYDLPTLTFGGEVFPGFESDGITPTQPVDLHQRYTSGGYVASMNDVVHFVELLLDGEVLGQRYLDMIFTDFEYEPDPQTPFLIAAHLPGYSHLIALDAKSGLLFLLMNNKNVEPLDNVLKLAESISETTTDMPLTNPSGKKDVFQHIQSWDTVDHPLKDAIFAMANAIATESQDSIRTVIEEYYDLDEFGPKERAADLKLLPKLPSAMGGWAVRAYKVEESNGLNWIYLLMRTGTDVSDEEAEKQFILGMAAQPEIPDKVFHVFYHFDGFKVK